MTHTWNHLESASLAGGHRLEAWLGEDERGAFFRTAPGSEGKCALVKLVPEDQADAGTQLAIWQKTRGLHHPNLVPLLECGRTHIAGEPYLYAIFEYPDERLDAATVQRPLSEPEVRAVLAAVAEGLRYLHAQGLVHGALDAGHVVAVGDCIKLATDSLREPGGGEAGQARGRQADSQTDRWMLAQLAEALQGRVEQTPASVEERPAAEPLPALATHRGKPVPRWIYFAVAALVLLIVWLNVGRRAGPSQQPAPIPTPKVASGPPPKPVLRQPESGPVIHPNTIQSNAAQSNAAQPKAQGPAMWRVIAYAYASRAAAEKKVRALSTKWPVLHAQVFVPGRGNGLYLVALGGRMTRQEAVNLQRQARGKGLPKDTYVQNYSE